MENYNHNTHYDLPVKPSPNLPNAKAVNLYPSLCLFEGTNVSVGGGTDYPFQQFGSPYLKSNYSFIPKSKSGSRKPKHENKKCYGFNLKHEEKFHNSLKLNWIIYCYNNTTDKESFFNNFFDKLAGTDKLRKQIINGLNENEIKESWKKDLYEFKKIRGKYLLY